MVSQWASALRNELFSALVDVPDSRDSWQGLSQANACIHPVASGDIDLRKRPIRDSGGIHCSSVSYTDWHRPIGKNRVHP